MSRHIVEVFKRTSDEWCPNYPGYTVEVSYRGNIDPDGKMYRVCDWFIFRYGLRIIDPNDSCYLASN